MYARKDHASVTGIPHAEDQKYRKILDIVIPIRLKCNSSTQCVNVSESMRTLYRYHVTVLKAAATN